MSEPKSLIPLKMVKVEILVGVNEDLHPVSYAFDAYEIVCSKYPDAKFHHVRMNFLEKKERSKILSYLLPEFNQVIKAFLKQDGSVEGGTS